MKLKYKRRLLFSIAFLSYLLTWLPSLGLMNSLTWIGPITLPIAWVLFLNLVVTICTIVAYFLCFKPFVRYVDKNPIEPEEVK